MSVLPLRFACDIGGTFTDLVVEREGEPLRFYKRSTTPGDPLIGLLDAVQAAADDLGVPRRELLGDVDVFVHGTTRATNAVVTGTTARTALLCTRGHPDTLLWREGDDRRPPLDYRQQYPRPYVPRALTFELSERVDATGAELEPLDEEQVRGVLRELQQRDVEAIAVCLLWSIVDGAHERRVGELIEEQLPGVPYTLSHRLNPSIREYRRASSTAIDASVKPLMTGYFSALERKLQVEGFRGRLLSLTGSGGVLDVADVAQAPIHSIGSGPAAAPVAGRYFARLDAASDVAIVTDAGGTTYDVSLVRRDQIPWTRETTVGDHPGHALGFPTIDVRSIGAGGGSIGWVDGGGLLHVGPQSAGADPGPAAYGRGGTEPTVTDACIVLGYIDPERFLGGAMEVRAELAREAIERRVAEPLGLPLHEAASAILTLATERMVTAIEEITLNQGIDPRAAVLVGGGGGAGLYSDLIARRLGIGRVVIPEVAAALSASGALITELRQSFSALQHTLASDFAFDAVAATVAELRGRCEAFATAAGERARETTVELSVEARYRDQVWEVEVPLAGEPRGPEDVAALVEAFHSAHEELFAHADRGADVELVTWHATVRCALREVTAPEAPSGAASGAAGDARGERTACFPATGPTATAVVPVASLAVGERVDGPAIVEAAAQSIVVHPGSSIERLPSGSLLMSSAAAALARSRQEDACVQAS